MVGAILETVVGFTLMALVAAISPLPIPGVWIFAFLAFIAVFGALIGLLRDARRRR